MFYQWCCGLYCRTGVLGFVLPLPPSSFKRSNYYRKRSDSFVLERVFGGSSGRVDRVTGLRIVVPTDPVTVPFMESFPTRVTVGLGVFPRRLVLHPSTVYLPVTVMYVKLYGGESPF